MIKKEKPEETKQSSFIKITNANLLGLTLRQIAKSYTEYANNVIAINRIRELKKAKTMQLRKRLDAIEDEFNKLVSVLPKKQEEKKIKLPEEVRKPVAERDVETSNVMDSFEGLREEFERIKGELEGIR